MTNLLRTPHNLKAAPQVDLAGDLSYKPAYSVNSWFSVGHFVAENTVIDYLYHAMIVALPKQPAMMITSFSVTDETNEQYFQDAQIFPMTPDNVSEDKLLIKLPNVELTGDINHMHIVADMPHGHLDAELTPTGFPLYNGGTGIFDMLGMQIHQYSLPKVATTGSLTIDDHTYSIEGPTWFDRQWQNQNPAQTGEPTWGWMDLNLSDESYVSVWFPIDQGVENAWATYMTADGTQRRVDVEPIVTNVSDFYQNPGSPYAYPTKWHVEIPELAAEFDVIPQPQNQELQFDEMKHLNHYEAASKVVGTKDGVSITGYSYIELTGEWHADMFN